MQTREGTLMPWAPHALALFVGCGAVLLAVRALVAGHLAPAGPALACAAAAGGAVVALLVRPRRVRTAHLHAVQAMGTTLIAVMVFLSARHDSPDPFLLVWVALYCGFFFGPRALAAHVAFAVLAYSVAVFAQPEISALERADGYEHYISVTVVVTVSAIWIGALRRVVSSLFRRQERIARTDPLTGLGSRAELVAVGEPALAEHAEGERPVAVALIDLDGFRLVNDAMGHEAGDAILHMAGERLRRAAPAGALLVRLAADDFVVLLTGTDASPDGLRVVARLLGTMARPFEIDGELVDMTASAGLALAHEPTTLRGLVRDADLAMHAAKDDGGDQVRAFTSDMRARVTERREIERDLRRALGREEFSLRYQPIIDLRSGVAAGAEALVRWEHPTRGTVGPDAFIPAAEQNGLIVPLGAWVLDTALREARRWDTGEAGPPMVSVNLSPRQLLSDALVEEVRGALSRNEMAATRLLLEVTETTVMADPERAIDQLEQLTELGVHIAVDDFGTGHSSLEYLRRLPASVIKLARPFVRDIDGAGDPELARGIVELAHAIGKAVIAEGVEREEEAAVLRAMGCDYLQGYLVARPMHDADVRAFFPPARLAAGRARGRGVSAT